MGGITRFGVSAMVLALMLVLVSTLVFDADVDNCVPLSFVSLMDCSLFCSSYEVYDMMNSSSSLCKPGYLMLKYQNAVKCNN